ncbi:aminotransferase class I/II-fold pyridoxal phosphate-dependent enzyme [Guggenheimella bovis]
MKLVWGIDKVIAEDLAPFQMPGHKGRIEKEIYKYDLTEIAGTDNLSNPKDIILDTLQLIADTFGASHSFISVNGATGAVLGALSTAFNTGDEIIMMRNSHISVYDGVFLLGLVPKYIYPDENMLERLQELVTENTVGVVLTTPSFYGEVIEDDVFEFLVEKGVTIVVDESHGSHLKLIDEELSAMRYADIVVHSFHKTLPSMTQTAVMHLCTNKFTRSFAQKNMKLFMSTSPNYVLMRSVDIAMDIYINQGYELMENLLEMCANFKEKLEAETDFHIVYKDGKQDKTRLLIRHKDSVDYASIDRQLREMGVQTEFQSQLGLLLMPTIMNTQEDFDRLLDALKQVQIYTVDQVFYKIFRPEKALEIREAFLQESVSKSYRDAIGGIVTEYIIPYPPGSPIIVPGEIMSEELADYLDNFEGNILGLEHEGYVNILEDESEEAE